jgi:DUF1680 family protein
MLSQLRKFTLLLGLVTWGVPTLAADAAAPQSSKPEPKTAPRAFAKMTPVEIADVTWQNGFWADRQRVAQTTMLVHLTEIMQGHDQSQFLENFRVAAKLSPGRYRGPAFNDGDTYKWLEGLAAVYAQTHDEKLNFQLDEAIKIIAAAQREDGYLFTKGIIKAREEQAKVESQSNDKDSAAGKKEINADPVQFELYNYGHLFTAGCVHFRATGKRTLLDVAIKAADFLEQARQKEQLVARTAVCPAHYMGLFDLYHTTGNEKYLLLVQDLIKLRDAVPDGTDDNQDRLSFAQQNEMVGHAVRANYLYAGMTDLYIESGEPATLDKLQVLWRDLVGSKMYLTGACGAQFDGASPYGSAAQTTISRVHQAYGRPYQLPNSVAHNETCASIGNVLWNERMLAATGDARFADVVETTLLNAVLSGMSLDGTEYFYTNTLRQLDTMPTQLRWSRTRAPYLSSFCCPPNLFRTLAEVSAFAYSVGPQDVWVNLYGASELKTVLFDGASVQLSQVTNYPWDGKITLTVNSAPARPVAIHLRIPSWCSGAKLAIDGNLSAQPLIPGTYVALEKTWKAGQKIELTLPMPVRLIEANPLVEEDRNHLAVMRGPIVYCLESSDLKDVSLLDIGIGRDVQLAPRYDGKLLGGITVLEGNGKRINATKWGSELYRPANRNPDVSVPIRLIPYYAWGNRGKSEMSVWLPDRN